MPVQEERDTMYWLLGNIWMTSVKGSLNNNWSGFELCHEKTCLWGFRPGPTQTGLYNSRKWLEA